MVSSMTHYGGRLQWEDLQHVERYVPFQAYADSKLMNVMAAREMHRRCKGGGYGCCDCRLRCLDICCVCSGVGGGCGLMPIHQG